MAADDHVAITENDSSNGQLTVHEIFFTSTLGILYLVPDSNPRAVSNRYDFEFAEIFAHIERNIRTELPVRASWSL